LFEVEEIGIHGLLVVLVCEDSSGLSAISLGDAGIR
jgi:hypothetical protein